MSAMQVGPYVNFQGRAREAMEFYRRVLGGDLDLQAADERGATRPAGPDDRIAHARLAADGVLIIGTDGHPRFAPTVGDNLAIALRGTDKEGLTRVFGELAEGGTIKGPLTDQPSGAAVGYLLDRFGINWVVTIEQA